MGSERADRSTSAIRGRLFVFSAAIFWSFGGLFAKSLALDPLTIAFYRSFFAGLVLIPLVPRARRVIRPAMIPLAINFGVMTGLYLGSMKTTTAANAIFLQCTSTVWTIPLSLMFLRDRPDRRSLAGIGLAAIGIIAILLYGYDGRPNEGQGIALGLASGVGYAIVTIGLRGCRDLDPIWLSSVNNLGGSLALGAWILATRGAIVVPSTPHLLLLAAFGTIQMAIPYALFARGLREIDAPEASLIGLTEPVLNPIWVQLFVGESPAPATMVGGAFLLAGVAARYLPWEGKPASLPAKAETVEDAI